MRRGELRGFGQDTSGYPTFDENDIISVAMDLDNLKCYWAKNNTWITIGGSVGDPTSGSSGTGSLSMSAIATSGPYAFAIADDNAIDARFVANFGQDSSFAGAKTSGAAGSDFYYTPPAGYKALTSKNIPTVSASTFSYTGNANASGPFVYMGYTPSAITISGTTYSLSSTNPSDSIDWLSNGIKVRSSSVRNSSGTTYTISSAPVSRDFKYSNAR